LALNMQMPVSYNETLSALSMLVAIIGSGTAFALMNRQTINPFHLLFGSIALAMALVIMHYLGMTSMQMAANITYHPALFILSVLIAMIASAGALYLACKMP